MQSLSPTPLNHPSTPASHRRYPSLSIQTYQPIHSSPLAESPRSSPVISAQRRRSSYKAPFAPISLLNAKSNDLAGTTEDPQKAFLRERFKARCFERARKDRERTRRRVSGSRSSDGSFSGGSSDGDAEMDSEGEKEDEDVMQDEVRVFLLSSICVVETHMFSFPVNAFLRGSFCSGDTMALLAALPQDNGEHFP